MRTLAVASVTLDEFGSPVPDHCTYALLVHKLMSEVCTCAVRNRAGANELTAGSS